MSTLPETATFPRLRLIQTGGEPVTRQDVALYNTHCAPDCLFVNGFGLTETGPVCMYVLDQASPLPDHLVPVGYAVEDMEVLLLDDAGKAVAQGEVGEIIVQSDALAAGYWRNPTLTQATFLSDPDGGGVRRYRTGDLGRLRPDGGLEHLGGKDAQVKIRGNRVNIAEVEQALLNLEYVKVEEHFLDLGGDSLLASQLITRVIQTLGNLPVRALREAPTVAAMAMVIVQHQAEQVDPDTLSRWLAEVEGVS